MGVNIMLALGSMLMFSTFLGSFNKVMLGNNQISSQNEYYIAGLSYAQSVVDEAKMKAYEDPANPLLLGIDSPAEKIGRADTLGALGYASESKFDDVDDYDGYTRLVNSPRAEGYEISASVNWVDPKNLNTVSPGHTDYKRMVVRVTSRYFPKIERGGVELQDTVKLTYFFNR